MDLFAQNIATSANLKVLTATTTDEAEEGTYKVKVDKIATATKATSKYNYMTTIVETTNTVFNQAINDGRITATLIETYNQDNEELIFSIQAIESGENNG